MININAEDIHFIRKMPCPAHKGIVKRQHIILWLLVFNILISIVQGNVPMVLIAGFIRLVSLINGSLIGIGIF